MFDNSSGNLVPLGNDYPALDGVTLGETQPYSYVGADGTELAGLLTLPTSGDAANLPAVVMPSGAHAFERFDFDVLAQFIAAQGYAVFRAGQRQNLDLGELYEEGQV